MCHKLYFERKRVLKNHYWIWDSAIPSEICDFVINTCNWDLAEDGSVYDGKKNIFVENKDLRITDVLWAKQLSVIGCIASSYIKAANEAAEWNYDYSLIEQIQLARYRQGGHYDWHKDTFCPNSENQQRKLSISILLNDPSEFNGGDFMFRELEDFQQPKLKKGSVIVFPSFLEHTVSPITSGIRYSAVTWAFGNAFR